ncbi:MAG: molecular chaperone HscA [Myxococcota bacterium]|jgi:molecular chaperone HscA
MPLITIQEPIKESESEVQDQEIAIGIDLGTTNSLIAISINQKPEILFDANKNFIQPSIVAFDGNENLVVGNETKNLDGEKIYSIKRLMGKGFSDVKKDNHFKIKNHDGKIKILFGNKELSPEEISAQILKHLKNIAEIGLGKTISKAVITVPAYFDESARNATKQAASIAGLEVLRLISEPTAAAVAYGLDKEGSIKKEGVYAVFDLGGGTFDVSILELKKGVFKVIGVGGDSALGGDDFDHLIFDKIIQENNLKNISILDAQNIKLSAKKIKEELTSQSLSKIKINLENQEIDFQLDQKEFENLSQNLIQKTIQITQDLLDDLDLENEQIKSIILVGGSTRMNLVTENLEKIFGEEKILDNIDPDKIVALGAAIQAEALTTRNSDNLLLDVIPLSLGIEMMGGLTDKIIFRNSTIPTSSSKEFTTYADYQNAMKFHIVQGERELAKDCRSLVNFEIKNIPSLKAGVARVKVIFKIDADGLLTISATETLTEETQIVEVKPTFGLDESQVKNMLLESLKNSKGDMNARLLAEAKVEAKRSILALESALKEDKESVDDKFIKSAQDKIKILETAIESGDSKKINAEAEELEEFAKTLAEVKMNQAINESLIGKKIDNI